MDGFGVSNLEETAGADNATVPLDGAATATQGVRRRA